MHARLSGYRRYERLGQVPSTTGPRPQFGLLLAALLGLAACSAAPQPKPPAIDQACELSPHALYYCRSQRELPLLVLIGGLGTDSRKWPIEFVRALQQFAGTVTYNRRGYPPSRKLTDKPVLASQVAADLNRLLDDLKVTHPVILVGHSLGGLYANFFARRYPERVAGVVLMDAASPEQPVGSSRFRTRAEFQPSRTSALEFAGFDESIRQTKSVAPFPDVPLLVLTATKHQSTPEVEQAWLDIQFLTAAESPRGSQIIAKDAGSDLHAERPAWTAAMIQDFISVFAVKPTPKPSPVVKNGPAGNPPKP